MKLHCLGTTGYHPSESRQTACYFLPESGIVLDAGTGIFRLPKYIATDHLDILLSHGHLDHTVGLTYLLDIRHQRPVDRVRVWGEREKLAGIREHLFSRELFPVQLDVEWNAVSPEEPFVLDGGAKVTPIALEHPGGSIGYRLDWPDRSMAYISDTTAAADADYVGKVSGVNLLLHECNFRSHETQWAIKTGHSAADQVGAASAAIGADQTWLIHINPLETSADPIGIADAHAHHKGIGIASDNQIIEF